MLKGKFIVVDGMDGAGKSTVTRAVTEWLLSQGLPVMQVRDPGGSAFSENIMRDVIKGQAGAHGVSPTTEMLLFFAARSSLIDDAVLPALANGQWVVCDRFVASTLAYQGHGLRDVDPTILGKCSVLKSMICDNIRPDFTFILDLPYREAIARCNSRGALDYIESRGEAYFHRVREGFRYYAHTEPNCHLLDASRQPEDVIEEVTTILLDAV